MVSLHPTGAPGSEAAREDSWTQSVDCSNCRGLTLSPSTRRPHFACPGHRTPTNRETAPVDRIAQEQRIAN